MICIKIKENCGIPSGTPNKFKSRFALKTPVYYLSYLTIFLSFVLIQYSYGQYTDQINSNRPGMSIGAFAVGKNVIQAEAGMALRNYQHNGYNNSNVNGLVNFMSLRWGFLFETLELTYEGSFMWDQFENKMAGDPIRSNRKGFLQNFLGIKFLFFDPFKNPEEVNMYSWKANNGFKLKHLIPALSLTAGVNLDPLKENPYSFGNVFNTLYRPLFFQNLGQTMDTEPRISLRATLASQSHFLGTWVFVTNWNVHRILTDYIEKSYLLTLTHTFHPLWSVYVENQGIYSDFYKDTLFRIGAAYLVNNNMQVEATLGSNIKDTPSQFFVNAGVSYRLDFHKDFKSGEEIQQKEAKKEERSLKKSLRKASKKDKKRTRKARRN